jgi:hypothetical protein
LREARAIPHLGRILRFDQAVTTGEPFHFDWSDLIAVARSALAKIRGEDGGRPN